MLMKVPWIESTKKRIEGRFSLVDLVPTVLDLIGADIPDQLHGRSRLPVITGDETLAGSDVVVEWNGRNLEPSNNGKEFDRIQNARKRALIASNGWKLIVGHKDRSELFNLNSDPSELNNLIYSKDHQQRAQELLDRLKNWQKTVNDDMELATVKEL